MYFVIAGCGRVGARLASVLAEGGHDVVVIDRSRDAFVNLGSAFDGVTLVGNAIDADVLREAGIADADGFAAVTSNDNVNIMCVQIARELFHVPRVVARAYDPQRQGVYQDFGIDTVCATELGALQLRTMLLSRGLTHRTGLGNGEVVEVELSVHEEQAGRSIMDLEQPGKMRISAVIHCGNAMVPDESYRTAPGDLLLAAVRADSLAAVRTLFGVE